MATLDQPEAGPLWPGSEVMLIDQRAQDDSGEVGESDRDDVLEEAAFAYDFQAAGADVVDELDGAVSARRARESETELVDGKAQILDFVVAEPEPSRQAGRRNARQSKELGAGRDYQADLVGISHDRRTVPPATGGRRRRVPVDLVTSVANPNFRSSGSNPGPGTGVGGAGGPRGQLAPPEQVLER